MHIILLNLIDFFPEILQVFNVILQVREFFGGLSELWDNVVLAFINLLLYCADYTSVDVAGVIIVVHFSTGWKNEGVANFGVVIKEVVFV